MYLEPGVPRTKSYDNLVQLASDLQIKKEEDRHQCDNTCITPKEARWLLKLKLSDEKPESRRYLLLKCILNNSKSKT